MGNVRGSRSEERRLPARTRAVSALTIMEEGFGADGKETEIQEDNQAEAGEGG